MGRREGITYIFYLLVSLLSLKRCAPTFELRASFQLQRDGALDSADDVL